MNDFLALAKKRRSTRFYTEQALDQDTAVDLMKAALMAPTSKNTRGWEFILVDDKHLLHQLSECRPNGAQFLKDAALAVVICADPGLTDMWIENTTIAATFLLLQAEDMGLGGCWIQVRARGQEDGTSASEWIKEILQIPAQYEVECMVAVGYKAKERKPFDEEKLQWEKMHINRY